VIANESLQSGDYRSASDGVSSFLTGLGNEPGKPLDLRKLSDPQRRLFFSTLVQVLSVTDDYDPTSLADFKYKDRWRALLADRSFADLFSNDPSGFSSSPAQNWAMGMNYLRYAETTDDIAQAYRFIHHVNETGKASDKATTTYLSGSPAVEGLILALQGKRDEAVSIIAKDPIISTNYTAYDLTFKMASKDWLVGSYFGPIVDRLSTKFNNLAMNDVCTLIHDAFIQALSAQIEDMNTAEERAAFLKIALDYYSEVQSAVSKKDFDHVLYGLADGGLLTRETIAGMTPLDTAHLSAKFYQLFGGPGAPTGVVVRFISSDPTSDKNAGDSCSGHAPANNREVYWVFRKTAASSPDHQWRIMPMPVPRP
jgi:hypothetical protein